jgi:hypothetical protein
MLSLPVFALLTGKAGACRHRKQRCLPPTWIPRQSPPDLVEGRQYTAEELGQLLLDLRNAVKSDSGGAIDKAFAAVMGTPNPAKTITSPNDLNDFGGEFSQLRKALGDLREEIRRLREGR